MPRLLPRLTCRFPPDRQPLGSVAPTPTRIDPRPTKSAHRARLTIPGKPTSFKAPTNLESRRGRGNIRPHGPSPWAGLRSHAKLSRVSSSSPARRSTKNPRKHMIKRKLGNHCNIVGQAKPRAWHRAWGLRKLMSVRFPFCLSFDGRNRLLLLVGQVDHGGPRYLCRSRRIQC